MSGFIDKTVQGLTAWKELTRAVEALLVDNLAATSPWLAPVIPAYLGWRNMTQVLEFPGPIALIGAAVIETLGLATVHTVFTLWDYNESKKKSEARAPVLISIVVALLYVMIVLVVNVLLDPRTPIEQIAQALLSVLSVVAAITLAIRANHARRLVEIKEERQERREMRIVAKNARLEAEPQPALPAHNAPHAELAASIKTYICDQCETEFESSQKLAAHKRWDHPKAESNGHEPVSSPEDWIKATSKIDKTKEPSQNNN